MRKTQRGRRRIVSPNGELQCLECEQWLPTSEFRVRVRSKWKSKHHDSCCDSCRRLRSVARNHNLTVQACRELLARAGGKCEICGRQTDSPYIDHSHDTGCIFGVLCPACNGGLGMFGHNPETLRIAAVYLERGGALQSQQDDLERKRRMAQIAASAAASRKRNAALEAAQKAVADPSGLQRKRSPQFATRAELKAYIREKMSRK